MAQTPASIHNYTREISIQKSTSANDRPPLPDRIAQSSPSCSDTEPEVVKYNRLYYEVMALSIFTGYKHTFSMHAKPAMHSLSISQQTTSGFVPGRITSSEI